MTFFQSLYDSTQSLVVPVTARLGSACGSTRQLCLRWVTSHGSKAQVAADPHSGATLHVLVWFQADAAAQCEKDGGSLAVIETEAVVEFLKQGLQDRFYKYKRQIQNPQAFAHHLHNTNKGTGHFRLVPCLWLGRFLQFVCVFCTCSRCSRR